MVSMLRKGVQDLVFSKLIKNSWSILDFPDAQQTLMKIVDALIGCWELICANTR
jgi:hypothetical protein